VCLQVTDSAAKMVHIVNLVVMIAFFVSVCIINEAMGHRSSDHYMRGLLLGYILNGNGNDNHKTYVTYHRSGYGWK